MADDPKNDPRSRLRAMLTGEESKAAPEVPSPLSRLPRKSVAGPPYPRPEDQETTQGVQSPRPPRRRSTLGRFKFGPTFWTATGLFSLAMNGILLLILALVLFNFRNVEAGEMTSLGSNFLGGLHENFEKMDRAHIKTTIPVESSLPVKFELTLNQQTNVVLSQDVTITNALVTVETGGLNITRARTTIVLPQGTNLPVILNLKVPVDTAVPVTLEVPVDIAMNETELHEPFVGLQQVVMPFLCMLQPAALSLDGRRICR